MLANGSINFSLEWSLKIANIWVSIFGFAEDIFAVIMKEFLWFEGVEKFNCEDDELGGVKIIYFMKQKMKLK